MYFIPPSRETRRNHLAHPTVIYRCVLWRLSIGEDTGEELRTIDDCVQNSKPHIRNVFDLEISFLSRNDCVLSLGEKKYPQSARNTRFDNKLSQITFVSKTINFTPSDGMWQSNFSSNLRVCCREYAD